MPRTARIIVPNYPHHVTQRGNRRMPVFFRESDYALYLELLSVQAKRYSVTFWAYCLMDNHVHFIAVPEDTQGFALMFREAHRRYTRYINKREGWTGHLWQGRYASFLMDEPHALMAARYIENNPVHAGMVRNAEDYKWSSAAYHTRKRKEDILVPENHTLKGLIQDWHAYLGDSAVDSKKNSEKDMFLKHEKSGKPLISI